MSGGVKGGVAQPGAAAAPGEDILHVDLDAFYAAVEILRDPTLRGKPVIVGAGVVLSASYEARVFGVRSGMPTGRAKQLCPRAVVVGGSFGNYGEKSDEVFEICRRFTPLVQQVSIDEAFLDVSGAHGLFGSSAAIGSALRREVRAETGLVLSVGIARTKFLAKVASQVAKPDGLVVVPGDEELDFLHALPTRYLWGVGPVMQQRLGEMGLLTIGDVASSAPEALRSRIGPGAGRHLYALAWNLDPRNVELTTRAGSLGSQSTFGRDVRSWAEQRNVLMRIADRVGERLRAKSIAGRTITLHVRFADFQTITRSATLRAPVSSTVALFETALVLLERAQGAAEGRGLRLLGIRVSNLSKQPHLQLELPLSSGADHDDLLRAGSSLHQERTLLDRSVDRVRDKFGRRAVGPASSLLRGDRFGDKLSELMTRQERLEEPSS